jgi:hypothetical protein
MTDFETNDIAYLSSKHKRDAAKQALLQARMSLERAAEEVDNYLEKFRDAESDSDKAKAINWCIHYLANNVISNLRLDRLAVAQSDLNSSQL